MNSVRISGSIVPFIVIAVQNSGQFQKLYFHCRKIAIFGVGKGIVRVFFFHLTRNWSKVKKAKVKNLNYCLIKHLHNNKFIGYSVRSDIVGWMLVLILWVPWNGLQCVIVAFPGHTLLHVLL